ncbi:hypothetical protein VTN77DRAFT_4371 [Rasamsonia byssochlamydoides]|uniref:uncharacterized protein n=1 Tax=Rasamsonia byssochlamydoides TaxID=89139 RepID=UPI0037424001
MDCGSTGTTTGIDPKILDKWQSDDSNFSVLSWQRHDFEHPPDLEACHDSNEGDAEFVDLVAAQGPPSRDSLEVPLIDSAGDVHTLDFSTSNGLHERVSFIGGTFSPRTHPSSGDESSQLDNAWNQFQLSHPMAFGMPLDAPVLHPYAKSAAGSTGTIIVDDGGELGSRGVFSDFQSHQMASLQQFSQPVQYGSEAWQSTLNNATSFVPSQFPISPPLEPQSENKNVEIPVSGAAVDQQWFAGLEMSVPPSLTTSFPSVSQGLGVYDDSQQVKPEPQNETQSPSLPGDVSGVFESSYSVTNDGIGMRQVKEEDSQALEWNDSSPDEGSSETSPVFPKISAFMVSQDSSDLPQTSFASNSGGVTAAVPHAARHIPLAFQPASAARKRKQRNSVISVEQINQPKPLQIVQEDGLGGSISSEDFVTPPRGARRKGPLSTIGRANAGLRRKNKDTCVQCRLNKRKCDGNSPCDACRPTLHEQPCARACFASIVEYGTCNYISQRAINHATLNGSGRVRMEIPSAFNLNDLLSFLSERRGRFNIRASQEWGNLYVLDLAESYKFLKGLSEYNDNSQSTFLEFIDHRIIESKDKSKHWLSCVKDCDPMNQIYDLLSKWNNMPSRASYSFVSVDGSGEDRPMDVNNPEDRKEILLAAQLSRIFCRILEVEGFRKLERDFYNIKWKRISLEAHLRFLTELGRILLSLRWRVSWWRRLGDGGVEPDPSQQHYVDRVDLLCRILYVYYTSVLGKLPSWSTSDIPKGMWSRYADTEQEVWDDFPLDATESGFQKWMERGRELIEQAGVPKSVSTRISKA